jgi:tetratricopeptide (TPR) repeat protein
VNSDSDSSSHWQYVDFDLEIGEQMESRKYPVSARSPEGEAREEMRFPFDEWELKDRLRDVEFALLRSGGSRRRIGTPEEQTIQVFGRALFEALIVGEVGTHYRVSWREARRQNKGLRVKLHVRPPELTSLPWEFVYDPNHSYLGLSSRTPLVRYPDVPHPLERLMVAPPLRILGLVASPQGLSQLHIGHEKRLVEEALRGLQARRLVELTWLEGQTWRHLQRAMRRGPWHVFHFIGHGGFDPETEEGAIALSDEEGRMHLLGASDLALLLDDHYFLRLVFLNSCEGARGSPRDAFSSTAATLVRSGIPAVVAMQYEITDRSAIEFSRSFYDAVADRLPVDAAVAEARTAVKMGSALEWGTPVLYMRSEDGLIFDISSEGRHELPPEVTEILRRYRERVESAWTGGDIDARQAEQLGAVAIELGLTPSAAADIEREVMGETLEEVRERRERAASLEMARKERDTIRRYREALEWAWADEDLNGRDAKRLADLVNRLGLSPDTAARIEREVMGETKEAILDRQEQAGAQQYRKALEEAWADNKLSDAEAKWLGTLASELGLSTDTVADVELDVIGDTIPAVLRRHRRLDELYARARRLHQDQEWQMVLDDFERIRSQDPAFPDPEGLLASAREALVRGRKVAALYDQASRYVDGSEWQRALECFEEIQRLEPGYRKTEELLSRVRRELAPPPTAKVPDISPDPSTTEIPDLPGKSPDEERPTEVRRAASLSLNDQAFFDELTGVCSKYTGRGYHVDEAIPGQKLADARASIQIPAGERVIALVDNSSILSKGIGLAVCGDGIRWRNYAENPASNEMLGFLPWSEFADVSFREYQRATEYGIEMGRDNVFVAWRYDAMDQHKLVTLLRDIQSLVKTALSR